MAPKKAYVRTVVVDVPDRVIAVMKERSKTMANSEYDRQQIERALVDAWGEGYLASRAKHLIRGEGEG